MHFLASLLRHKHQRHLFISLVILSCILGLGQYFQTDIVFDRNKIELGYWWRLVSGNFTHSNIPHLLLNLSGLWVLYFLFFDSFKSITFILSTILLAPFVGTGLYLYNPELHFYYGFSGVLYGLYFIAAVIAILQKDYFTGASVALLISGKIAWDYLTGGNQSSAELIGVPVANDAHLYGYLGALAITIYLIIHFVIQVTKEAHPPPF